MKMVVVSHFTEITILKCAYFLDGQLLLATANAASLWTGNSFMFCHVLLAQLAYMNMMSD